MTAGCECGAPVHPGSHEQALTALAQAESNGFIYALLGVDPDGPLHAPPCEDEYCGPCAARECPHDDPLHRHHDGCPTCDGNGTPEP